MSADQIANFAYLGLLGVVIAGSYLVANRHQMGKMAQQAAIWVLIFVGAIAAFGLWGDIRQTIAPRQSVVSAGEISLPRQPDGHFYITLAVNSVPVDFVVDTGASQIVLTRQDAARVGLNPADLRFIGSATTANGRVQTAPVRLATIELGEIRDENVPAVVNGGQMQGSLLGMSYLSAFSSIEMTSTAMILKR